MRKLAGILPGIALAAALALAARLLGGLVPGQVVGAGVFALLIGMALSPLVAKAPIFKAGINFSAKQLLRLSIVLMGLTLSFSQVFEVGGFSLLVMVFTLAAAYFFGWLLGRALGLNWELTSLLSVGTGVCGGSAIAAVAPVIHAKDRDIAYAISATFLFDVAMVVLFPLAARAFGMTDLGFGLWAGTAINDTSSVVAAAYAYSDLAGAYATIVKLTRTLSIIPTVLVFSLIYLRQQRKAQRAQGGQVARERVNILRIFPFFILLFLALVAVKSTGLVPGEASRVVSDISKFFMPMALGAIGLKTNFKEVAGAGFKPMLHGFLISAIVVVVSFLVQLALGQT